MIDEDGKELFLKDTCDILELEHQKGAYCEIQRDYIIYVEKLFNYERMVSEMSERYGIGGEKSHRYHYPWKMFLNGIMDGQDYA